MRTLKRLTIIFLSALFYHMFLIGMKSGFDHLNAYDPSYEVPAVNITLGKGFSYYEVDGKPVPETFRAPMTAFLMALIYWIFKPHPIWFNLIITIPFISLICCFIYLVGVRLGQERIGWLAAWIYLLHPLLKGIDNHGIVTFFLVLSLWLWVSFIKFEKWIWSLLAGFSMGLAVLTRSEYLLLPIFLVLSLVLVRSNKKILQASLVVLLGVGMIIAPWTLRNIFVAKRWVLINDGFFGFNFFLPTEETFNQRQAPRRPENAVFLDKFPWFEDFIGTYSHSPTYSKGYTKEFFDWARMKDQEMVRLGLENIKRNPWRYLRSRLRELLLLWIQSGTEVVRFFRPNAAASLSTSRLVKEQAYGLLFIKFSLSFLLFFPLYLLAAIGGWSLRQDKPLLIFLLSVPIVITLIHVPLWIIFRYSQPAYPSICLLFAYGYSFLNRRKSTNHSPCFF